MGAGGAGVRAYMKIDPLSQQDSEIKNPVAPKINLW